MSEADGMKFVQLGWLLPVLLALGGCKSLSANSCHGKQPYTQAQSVPPLKVPTGLDSPDTASALRIPALNEPPPPPRHGKDPCLDEPPPFKVRQPAAPPRA
jgi:uncharacterized lipoprotein